MAVMRSKDGKDLLIDCCCGCDDGIRFRVDTMCFDYYCFMSYTNGNFYRDQNDSWLKTMRNKLKKIFAIIRNKDHYYAEVVMTKDDFDVFKEYINSIK